MKHIKYMSILIIIIFLNTTNALADSYPRELVFCITNWNPYEYTEGNKAKGVNVEIVEAVANALGDPPYMIKTYFAFTQKKGTCASYKTLAKDFSDALVNIKSTEHYKRILEKYEFISQ